MSKAVCCLGIYAVITTIIIAILSWIISADIACSLVTNVTGTDNKINTSNNKNFSVSTTAEARTEAKNVLVGNFTVLRALNFW